MTDVLHGNDRQYSKLAASQYLISWRRFMEGMISKEILVIHNDRVQDSIRNKSYV